ncbi:innexin inx2-like protein [Dinothrombium tinctorium]|uniref:Innexin n=1 Tax=Dinothrombium tinctorium TaxID=1965070 RepID=A0A3S3PCV6_9ACAR|nr:innexin inx2-like protein [Dinothrombium tinctorium]
MDILKSLEPLKKYISPPTCIIDNAIFRLHYKLSVVILVTFAIVVTLRQYFGDPIDCISKDDIPSNLLDTFCWIHTTFSVENAWHKQVGTEVVYPGVDKRTPDEQRVYHAYYQWVCFVLFFQAIFFYVPRYLWKAVEGGRMRSLLLGLGNPIVEENAKSKNIGLLVQYLERNLHNHNFSFYAYVFTEALNLVNVLVQMVLMNKFLHGEFMKYGLEVIKFSEWDYGLRYDPMIRVLVQREMLEDIISRIDIGDWFILDLLAKNLNSHNFKMLVEKYYETLRDSKSV